MTRSVAQCVWLAAQQPAMDGEALGLCRLCGAAGMGLPFERWVKDTFTDHDKIGDGTIVCHACQFCACEATPGLAARVGKDKPQKFRNYSHIVGKGVWHPLSKGNKRQMRTLLMQNPDVALIALSGQKHLFFRATVGWWQIEEYAVRPFPAELHAALAVIEPLYHGGISKAEIASGRYQQNRVMQYGLATWRAAEAQLRTLRGSVVCDLALFLAQLPEEPSEETDDGA